jgi:phospholipid/cholesterol/gamma-HCH transport system substrate-binding protein
MSETRLQFAVGLVVLVALSIGTALVIRFGDLQRELEPRYAVEITLETAGGLYPSAPVLMSGLGIGAVDKLSFAEDRGVIVTVEIRPEVKIRRDSVPLVSRSLLGETVIEFVPGASPLYLKPGERIAGQGATDPLAALQRLEGRAGQVLEALTATGQEWQLVGRNVNALMETNRGNLDVVIERAAESLQEFTQTMQSANRAMTSAEQMIGEANKLIADPRAQQALKETMLSLPALVEETRRTIAATRSAVENVNQNLVNLAQVTEPVGQRGPVMVSKLESSLSSLDALLAELNRFAQAVNQPDGSLNKLASDPSLYDNLDRSAQSMAVLLKNLEPILRDVREFSDKVARNPELLGVGGALRPSAGLRDAEVLNPTGNRPATTSGRAVRSQQ